MHATDHSNYPLSPILDSRGPDPHPPASTDGHPCVDLAVDGDHAVEWLIGDIDVAIADHVLEVGTLAVAEPRVDELVIDLSQVTFLDSTGLGALIHLWHHSENAHKRLALRGVTPPVSKILTITGLDKVFGLDPVLDAGRC